MVAGGCKSPPGWRQALCCVNPECPGWKWVHRDDFRAIPNCHKCGQKFDFSKYEWHDKRTSTTPSTIRRRSEDKDAPWAGGKKAAAKAKAKAKAKPKAQGAQQRAQAAQTANGEEKPLAELKKVGLQEKGGAESAEPHQLQNGHLVVDPARAAKDPVYQCQVQVDLLERMNVDAADPRRVDADRRPGRGPGGQGGEAPTRGEGRQAAEYNQAIDGGVDINCYHAARPGGGVQSNLHEAARVPGGHPEDREGAPRGAGRLEGPGGHPATAKPCLEGGASADDNS